MPSNRVLVLKTQNENNKHNLRVEDLGEVKTSVAEARTPAAAIGRGVVEVQLLYRETGFAQDAVTSNLRVTTHVVSVRRLSRLMQVWKI